MNDIIPYLTYEDKLNAYEFLGDDKPAIIVEGENDIFVYEKILYNLNFDWENIDIVCAGGKSFIKNNYTEIPMKYIAIVDSDYDIYLKKQIADSRLIYTDFYTMENYLTTDEIIDKISRSYSTISEPYINGKKILDDIYKSIEPFILLCYKKLMQNLSVKLEDIGLETWEYKENCQIDIIKIENHFKEQVKENNDMKIEKINWNDLEEKLKAELDNGLDIRVIITGKRIFDALYYKFKNCYPFLMKGRKKVMFKKDLCTYLNGGIYIEKFLERIEAACKSQFGSDILTTSKAS